MADLTVTNGPGDRYGTRFPVYARRQKIGRGPTADIRIRDDAVSREHALIWEDDGYVHIQDAASVSGTHLNGHTATREVLCDEDEIRVGNTTLVFRLVPCKPKH